MRKGLFLIIILLFPSIIYMIFSLGEHRVEKIRSFGAYDVTEQGDTVYQPVPDVTFMNHEGERFSLSDFNGKPLVIDVVDVPCGEPCRKKGVTLVNYLNELPDRDKWTVLSLMVQPDVATPTLDSMWRAHLPEMENWHFVSAVDSTALQAFLSYTFVQTERVASLSELPGKDFALIDQSGVVRAFFDSRVYVENRKLEDAIKLLLQEPYLEWKDEKGKK